MNALHRDLARLVAEAERQGLARAEQDPYRLRFHLMPPVGWMNDPNGLCRCGDWYHVFYQYGPFDSTGGVKHWGHYRSRDLIQWEQLPPLLYPDQTWDLHGVYSGSALVEDGVMYLYYTGNVKHPGDFDYVTEGRGHNTALAVCRDGVTAQSNELLLENRDYPAGLTCHVRDPKVFAYDGAYYMVQGARTLENRGELLVFESRDKRHWTHINTITTPDAFGYMWECPDLFELNGQWVAVCSPQGVEHGRDTFQNVYSCGYFPLDGDFRSAYTLGAYREMDTGFDFYAPQTFLDGERRLLIGWMGMPDAPYENLTVAYGWQHAMTVPCRCDWQNGRMLRYPAAELEALRRGPVEAGDAAVFDLELTDCAKGGLVIRDSAVLEWGQGEMTLSFTGGGAGRTVRHAKVGEVRALRILADTSSLEIFVNHGESVLTTRYYPRPDARGVRFTGKGKVRLWEMGSLTIKR